MSTGEKAETKAPATVLVVDDKRQNLELLELLMEHAGHRVLAAASGPEALEILENEKIDLALLDVAMPGMSGIDLCNRIKLRPETAHVPVILISGHLTGDGDVVTGLSGGADEYIVKPIDTAVLKARVESLLRIKSYEDRLREAYEELSKHAVEIERLNLELAERNVQLLAANRHINRELELAREVQLSLLPDHYPSNPGLRFAVLYEPSGRVGGDYYDFVEMVDDSVGVLVADAAGHGLPAAFIATVTKMVFENYAYTCASPSELATKLNAKILPTVKGGRYITCFYGIFHPGEHTLTFVRAGHPKPILLRARDRSMQELDSRGRPLGVLEAGDYKDGSVTLEPNDKIIIYTDGIIDCPNAAHERFGVERLRAFVRGVAEEPIESIVRAIHGELKKFSGAEEFRDDVTVVGIEAMPVSR